MLVLNNLSGSFDRVDIWRVQHPSERQYSFFSPVHCSFSRIDYFLISSGLISNLISTIYHSILVSDHSPISFEINFNLRPHQHNWKFNPSLYLDKIFCEYIAFKISGVFLSSNDNTAVSKSILWESFKVVLRGYIILYQSSGKRDRLKRLSDIEPRLSALEETYLGSKSKNILNVGPYKILFCFS